MKNNKNDKKTVSIVDYGLGNLYSLKSAIESLGYEYRFVKNPDEINNSEMLIIPGVGSFSEGMNNFRLNRLIEAVRDYVNSGKPLLGICLGMQLLFEKGEEFGVHEGLGVIPGVVKKLEPEKISKRIRLPHVGWSEIVIPKNKSWQNTILEGVSNNSLMYFVHSFRCVPKDNEDILAESEYGNQSFCSVVKRGNVYGTQFHPEKCDYLGLKILKRFLGVV
ncbi:imidazole glycerol phosphate synthase subunit HisH [Candidatus Woesearchaeota archaeon]|nr:imidazole glycerol phosphate synthase subunit HisH [Candidatus Woesearchaeota archaeon]